ncbi:ParB/RepB/Spo0J family partition protein, partial [Mycolicibacterium sp. CBMA 295]
MNQPARKRSGLGRGLAALIPTGPADDGGDALSPRMGASAADVLLGPSTTPTNGEAPGNRRTPAAAGVDPVVAGDMGATYREIDPSLIQPNPRQPRQVFDEEALSELVHSIREFGLMQPIVVRAVEENGQSHYQLVMGERRWRAAQQAGLEAIPAIVRETGDDNMLRDALLENIHRVQLNPLEEAAAYQQLLDEFDVTHDELAARI